jgi:Ca-activated chloride channel family protein
MSMFAETATAAGRTAAWLLAFAVLLLPAPLRAADGAPEGGLFFKTNKPGVYYEAPLVRSDVEIAVAGTILRATVRQDFINPSDAWLEGVYVFPLPERSAVDRLTMEVGGRRIVGEIKERAEAQRIYDTAAAAGRQASLVSQQRPNIFTSAVANIGPGEKIAVEIQYQDSVAVEDGIYSLRFPMVVAPRYIPGGAMLTASAGGEEADATASAAPGGGWAADRPSVPDASRITPPVLAPDQGKINPVTLTVDLNPGFALDRVISLYHPIVKTEAGDGRLAIALARSDVPADRDFVLEWFPAAADAPAAAIFAEERNGDLYLSAVIAPAPAAATDRAPPRDVTFVIDTSGSMGGPSIVQAKSALSLALDRLTPDDRFNVIQFNSVTNALFADVTPWNAETLAAAQAYVGGLEANGGTEMRPALRMALAGAAQAGRLKQVVFLTDAAIGNEAELFDDIAGRLGEARLFTIGIGAAPNSYFMRKAAELGRGSFTYIGAVGETGAKMGELLRKLERPALTGLGVAWPEALRPSVEMYPATLPDLYRGQPVTFSARLPGTTLERLAGNLALAGQEGGGNWTAGIDLGRAQAGSGIAAVWARAKLDAIEDRQWRGADLAVLRKEATAHALAYELVSAYTSLVAVAEPIVRPPGTTPKTVQVPTNLPEGWNYEKVFGPTGEAGGAGKAPGALMREIDFTGTPLDVLSLPQTATPAMLNLLIGAALLAAAGLLWRRRTA